MKVTIKNLKIDSPIDDDIKIDLLEFEGSENEFKTLCEDLGIKR